MDISSLVTPVIQDRELLVVFAVALDDRAPEIVRDVARPRMAPLDRVITAVLVLHDIEGWTHEEISRELDMAVGSSKAQLHRGRGLLKRALRESP